MFALLTLGTMALAAVVVIAVACGAASLAGNILQVALFPLAAGATIFAATAGITVLTILVGVGMMLLGIVVALAVPIILIATLIGGLVSLL